jgi:hypothetical protein
MRVPDYFRCCIGTVLLSILLGQCSEKTPDKPGDEYIDCIVTDKAKLEEVQIFPSDNLLNNNISEMPKDTRSDAIMALIGSPSVHPCMHQSVLYSCHFQGKQL